MQHHLPSQYDYSGSLSAKIKANNKKISVSNKTYSATKSGQNSALVKNGGTLKLSDVILNKSGSQSNDDYTNFYGTNSILLAVNKNSKTYLSNSKLTSKSKGSNGLFASDKAIIYANNVDITTTKDNSRGLDATYGGTIIANEMNIKTDGDHSASVATDRGGGSISITNSQFTTNGSGSPLLYSTGNIQVDNVSGSASNSQIAGMEGLNTILVYNSTLTSTMKKATASDPVANGVIIYQSTSGDAEATTGEKASFEVSNSTLKSSITSGSMFYFTNTKANVVLSESELDFDSEAANLLLIQGNNANNWGSAGSNGADVTFTGLNEKLNGNIEVDSISSLDLYLLDNTTYTGAISITKNTVNTSKTKNPITLNLDGTSKWIVSDNSTISNLNVEDSTSIVDENGKLVSIIVAGKKVVSGDSEYTLNVTNNYSNKITTNSNNELSDSFINRSNFDKYYDVETLFNTNDVIDISNYAKKVNVGTKQAIYSIISFMVSTLNTVQVVSYTSDLIT